MLIFVTTLLILFVLLLFLYFQWSFGYWVRKGVQTLPPTFPFGNAAPLFTNRANFGEFFKIQYDHLKRLRLPYGGCYVFACKYFIPVDPELVKRIMQVDFQHFINHGNYVDEEWDPLSGNLFSLEGAKWKSLREKLTPTFTSGKIKTMFPLLMNCGTELGNLMEKHLVNKRSVDIKNVLGRFTTDMIMTCAFGIDANCLKDPESEFYRHGRMIFQMSFAEKIKRFHEFILPRNILSRLKFKSVKQPVEDFILDLVRRTVDYREKNNVYRKDFMHLLIQLKNMGKVTDDERIKVDRVGEVGLTMTELAAQAFVFFAAGFETSSTTMTFALHELSINQDIQAKLRAEIEAVLGRFGGQITYEAIMEMSYLDQVISETLRKYPPGPTTFRKCNKDYKVPNSDVVIEKDTFVMIPILGIHRNEEFYPNPEQFDPERFSEENKNKRHQYTFLPFGEGPRICIGLRFGLLQTKIGIITILKRFKLLINPKTKVPIEFNKSEFILSAAETIWIDIEPV